MLGMETRYSNSELSRAGLCSEGAVRNARKDGRLDDNDAASVAMFVLQMRMKAEGWGFFPDASGLDGLIESGAVTNGVGELHYEPDGSQEEGEW